MLCNLFCLLLLLPLHHTFHLWLLTLPLPLPLPLPLSSRAMDLDSRYLKASTPLNWLRAVHFAIS